MFYFNINLKALKERNIDSLYNTLSLYSYLRANFELMVTFAKWNITSYKYYQFFNHNALFRIKLKLKVKRMAQEFE